MEIISTGRYKYQDGEVIHTRSGITKPMKGGRLPSGYVQMIIFNGRRGEHGIKVIIYKHVFIYMLNNGTYPEGYEIDHKDRDVSNNKIENLRSVDSKANSANKRPSVRTKKQKNIRHKEISMIRQLLSQGKNQSEIARELNLGRLAVRYIVKQIESGAELKYER